MVEIVELRVHGVSNTPPESMLKDWAHPDPTARLVFGDEQTGFYRRVGDPNDAPVLTEAYSWGQLTSGSRGTRATKDLQRAGWALLFPFAIVNVALWAVPARAGAVQKYLIRVLALGLTATMALAAAGIGMDQVGWQCRDGCPKAVPFTDFLRTGHWSEGLRPVAVGMLVPIALLLVLWLLARRTFAYEATVPVCAASDPDASSTPFEEPSFWSGAGQVRRLAALHAAIALIAVGGMALIAGRLLDTGTQLSKRPAGWAAVVAVVAAAALVVALATVVTALARDEVRDRHPTGTPPPPFGAVPSLAFWTALLGVGLAAVYLVADREIADGVDGPLPGFGVVITVLFAVQLAVLALLAVLNNRGQTPGPAWGGRSAAVLGGLGWAVASLYSAAVLFWVADHLNGAATVTSSASALELPVALLWSALGLILVLAIVSVMTLTGWYRLRKLRRGQYPEDGSLSAHQRLRAWDVARWRALHEFIGERGLRYIGLLAVVVALVAVGGLAGALTGLAPAQLVDRWSGQGFPFVAVKWLTDTGSALAALLLLGLAALVGSAYRSAGLRRTIGTVWDVATFWPRGAHPFAPPCYGERAVPQLVTRIGGAGDQRFVLAAHSQGAVLAVAAVQQLPEDARSRVFLLTYGTQLARLYGKIFPAFFGPGPRRRVAELLGHDERRPRWRSLARLTDPIGWEIAEPAGVDRSVPDPTGLSPENGEVLDPEIRQHSDYPCSDAYREERDKAVAALRADVATAAQPPEPAAAVAQPPDSVLTVQVDEPDRIARER